MKLEAITLKEERELFSLNENEPMEYGCIGHLRGDFGGSGKEYYSTWFDHTCKHLNDAKCMTGRAEERQRRLLTPRKRIKSLFRSTRMMRLYQLSAADTLKIDFLVESN